MQALKEWAIVCKALEEGRQVVLLRKGGILEYRQGFEVKHAQFLLFPTFEHQSKDYLQQDYANKLDDDILKNQPTMCTNKMSLFANVVYVKEITDHTAITMLAKYHIWNESYVNARLNYNPSKPMSAMLLRVFKLDTPISVDIKPEWSGCRSWIPIDLDVNGKNSSPVIDDLQFANIAAQVREVLSIAA